MKMMVCLDSSKQALAALYKAKDWAGKLGAEVLVITSFITRDRFHEEDIAAAEKSLEEAKRLLAEDDVPGSAHLSIRGMEPGDDLLDYACDHEVDAIFVGIKKRSRVGKLILGSVAQDLILKAECPVVTDRN